MNYSNSLLLLITLLIFSFAIGQEDAVEKQEIEELTKKQIDELRKQHPKPRPKPRGFSFTTYDYEFVQHGNEILWKTIKNKSRNPEETIVPIPVSKVENLAFVAYDNGFEYHHRKTDRQNIKRHTQKNYIVYHNKRKYGLVLGEFVIPAKYDSIGKPYLLKGEKPMHMVAKKKRGKLKWGIIKADGTLLLPLEYDHIILPLPADTALTAAGNNNINWSNKKLTLLLGDGLYHDLNIIVQQGNAYGMFTANGEKVLDVIYDEISPNSSFSNYVIRKDNLYGIIIHEQAKIGTWGLNRALEKEKGMHYIVVKPKYEYYISETHNNYFFVYPNGTKTQTSYEAIIEMIKK